MDKKQALLSLLEKIKFENDGKHIDFVIPGYASKRLVAYQSIREDLIVCKEAMVRIHAKFDEVITLSLYHTIIILYGKCFTDATSSKSPKLETKDCFTEKDQGLLKVHNEIIELRHNFTAHRGSTENEVGFAYMRMNVDSLSRQVRVKQLKRRMPKAEDFPRYVELFDHLIKVVEAKFQKEANKIADHLFEQFTPEQLALLKIAGPTTKTK